MSISITNGSKNSVNITNTAKPTGETVTWDEATFTWDDAEFTWNNIGLPITKTSKNSITITNDTKN